MPIYINREKVYHYSKLELIAKQVVEGFITGLHKSPFHGFSVEFAEHRLYNTGESTKHVDWKLFGRTDKLFVKRYEEETNLRCQLVIDTSSSMNFPEIDYNSEKYNKLKFSIYASAAIINILKNQRDAVGLSIFNESLDEHIPAKSSVVHHQYIIHQLEQLLNKPPVHKKTSAVEALHVIAENTPKRSLIILFSDLMENTGKSKELLSALQHLRHNKHEVIVFHTTDKAKELDFEFENRPYQFIDLETDEQIKLHPNEVKDYYVSRINDIKKELKLECGKYGIDWVEVDIDKGFDDVLMTYLLKRKKM